MANNTISPNMGLIIPTVGQEPGPDWGNDQNASFGTIDQHNHSAGQGVPINPAGLNINSDLAINSNNLTSVKTVNFQAQSSSLTGIAPNLGCIYVAGNELVYNDEAGNVVPITNNGSVNAGAGSITGLPSGTASASYSSVAKTFTWQSATVTPANLDAGAVILREVVANANGVTLNSPSALAADYSVFFPSALPGSRKLMTLDSGGNIGDVVDVDNSTIVISSNTIQVPNDALGIIKLKSNLRTTSVYGPAGTYAYTVPSDVTYLRVIGCGGGGGGQGGKNTTGPGGGAGYGAPIFEGVLSVVAGETLTVVVGAGGAGSPNGSSPASGSNGGDSTITGSSSGLMLVMKGGVGGNSAYAQPVWENTYHGYAHYGGDRTTTGAPVNSTGMNYLLTAGASIGTKSGGGALPIGGAAGGGGGSIGIGGQAVQNPGPGGNNAPWVGGIGAGGGGMDALFNGVAGYGGDGQVTIFVL